MSRQWDIISGVGITALAAAAARAVESSRPDRLIDDPLAAAFVDAAQTPLPFPVRWPDEDAALTGQQALLLLGANYTGLRSRFFDDFLRGACSEGAKQAVLLAAGLDTRAFRMDWSPGFRLFEIDQPKVLEFKDAVLRDNEATARCTRTAVAVDLRDDWGNSLRNAGFDPAAPTAWLAEGLLQYLPAEAEQQLFIRIDELSAAGSHLAVERSVNLAGLDDGTDRLREVSERTGIPMDKLVHADTRPDSAAWLAEHGWTAVDEPVDTVAERYHRDLTDPRLIGAISGTESRSQAAPGQQPAGFMTASKR